MESKTNIHHQIFSIATIVVSLCIISFFTFKITSLLKTPIIKTPISKISKSLLVQPIPNIDIPQIAKPSTTFRIPILMYHYVEYTKDKKDTIRQSLDINPNIFEKQVKTLVDSGYTFMTAKELGQVIDNQIPLPNNPILLTFDDGHWDFDTVVVPILKKYNIKATVYVISSFLGKSDFMTNNQLQDVIDSGLVDVGAHTVHHVSLKGKNISVVTSEVNQSKTNLENIFHISVISFAYPNGAFDQQAISVIQDNKFTTAVSTHPGIEQSQKNRFSLYRLRPGNRSGSTLINFLTKNNFSSSKTTLSLEKQ